MEQSVLNKLVERLEGIETLNVQYFSKIGQVERDTLHKLARCLKANGVAGFDRKGAFTLENLHEVISDPTIQFSYRPKITDLVVGPGMYSSSHESSHGFKLNIDSRPVPEGEIYITLDTLDIEDRPVVDTSRTQELATYRFIQSKFGGPIMIGKEVHVLITHDPENPCSAVLHCHPSVYNPWDDVDSSS